MKPLTFFFKFPPFHGGLYDTGDGAIYIFGDQWEHEIEDVITHEVLHFVLQKVAGDRASVALDRVVVEANLQ